MAKKLMPGKNQRDKGKKVSHGNSHASADEVRWDSKKHKWVINNKGN